MIFSRIIVIILFASIIYAKPLIINNDTKYINILEFSKIYIDKSKNKNINDIKDKDINFKDNHQSILGFGYAPNFDVWIKFTLKNSSKDKLHKIIEYDNSLTSSIQFFNPDNNYKIEQDGLLFKKKNHKTVNPIFKITLKPYETKTYYLKSSSYITTLIVKLKLWDNNSFYNKEIEHQIILSLFFGAMLILAVYNLFIFFFTKDISYLYYVLYILGIIIHHLFYVGIGNLYLFSSNMMSIFVEFAALIVAIPIYSLGFFTKKFLQIEKYPIHNKILNAFLISIPIAIIFFITTDGYEKYRNVLTMMLLIYLMYLTIYAVFKKNYQAYFILFGWFIFVLSGMMMFLSSAGIFNIYKYFPYLIEISFVLEAIIFSIALANKINNLQKERNEANQRLLIQQKNETKRLTQKVDEKTNNLKKALGEKELLLKELNHRVKNNMQTIVSLIRLQNDDIEDKVLQDVLITIQNRINAMSHLHELLYNQDNLSHINAYEYFEVLIDEVKNSYENEINIHLNINSNLLMEQAIYCGLILNELITNSFKYAFPNKKGNIFINLENINNTYELSVKDDGIGYKNQKSKKSLGLTLIDTLAVNQLKGEIKILNTKGVETIIKWKNED